MQCGGLAVLLATAVALAMTAILSSPCLHPSGLECANGCFSQPLHSAFLPTWNSAGPVAVSQRDVPPCLQSFGLAVLMAKAGLAVPAAAPVALPCYGSVLADIGDEQSLSASLSTFSGHLRRIEVSKGFSVVQWPPSCGIETDAMHHTSAPRCSASAVLLGLPGLGSTMMSACLPSISPVLQ